MELTKHLDVYEVVPSGYVIAESILTEEWLNDLNLKYWERKLQITAMWTHPKAFPDIRKWDRNRFRSKRMKGPEEGYYIQIYLANLGNEIEFNQTHDVAKHRILIEYKKQELIKTIGD